MYRDRDLGQRLVLRGSRVALKRFRCLTRGVEEW